jgi:hypothetical protein
MAMALYLQSDVDNYLLVASTVFVLASALISVLARKNRGGEPQPTPVDKELLDEAICEILHGQSLELREIMAAVKPVFPEILKGEINSRLYTMLSKKSLQQTLTGKRPTWSLV